MPPDNFFGDAKNPLTAAKRPQGGLSSARLPINPDKTLGNDLLPHMAPTTQTWGEAISRLMPIVGDSWGIDDAKQSYKKGDKGTAALQGGLTAIGLGGLGHMVPAMAGIFVGKKGAQSLKDLGYTSQVKKSQELAKRLKEEDWLDQDIWRETAWEHGHPSTFGFREGAVMTELDDSKIPFNLELPPGKSFHKEFMPEGAFMGAATRDFYPHLMLDGAYPGLMDEPTFIMNPEYMGAASAQRFPDHNRINLSEFDSGSTYHAKGSLIHELQHAADRIEGLSEGSSPEYLAEVISPAWNGLANANAMLEIDRLSKKYNLSLDDAHNMWKHNTFVRNQDNLFNKAGPRFSVYTDEDYRHWLLGILDKQGPDWYRAALQDDIEPIVKRAGGWNPDEAYHKTQGEVRARLADRRRTLPMQQRVDFYPFNSYLRAGGAKEVVDVPSSEALVRSKDNQVMNTEDVPLDKQPSNLVKYKGQWMTRDEQREAMGLESAPEFKHGGLVKQLTDEECGDLMLQVLEHDATPKFAEGGLVSKALIDPAKGLFSQMDLIHPKNNQSAPLDIPLNSNNMLAKARAMTPQAQHYRTR